MELFLLGEGVFLGLLAVHAEVVGVALAGLALLGPAPCTRTDKAVCGIVLGILRFNFLSCQVLFGSIFWVPLLKLKLSLALEALKEIVHLPDGLELQDLKLLVS